MSGLKADWSQTLINGFNENRLSKNQKFLVNYSVAILVLILAVIIKLGLNALFTPTEVGSTTFLTFFAAVMLAAWYGGWGPGLLVTLGGAGLGNFFFMPPFYSFGFKSTGDFVNIILFIVEGGFISLLSEGWHRTLRRTRQEIAERQQNEQHQAELLAFLDTALASAPVGMGFLDLELRFVQINQVLADQNQLPVAAHMGRSITEVLPWLPPITVTSIKRVLQTGQPLIDLEISGTNIKTPHLMSHALVSYYPIKTNTGLILGVGFIVKDVTGRKQAEQAEQLLSEVSRHLVASFDYEANLTAVVRQITKTLLQGCFLHLTDDNSAKPPSLIALSHANPTQEETLRAFVENNFLDIKTFNSLSQVVRGGQAVFYQDVNRFYNLNQPGLSSTLLRELDLQSFISVPLVVRGRRLGVLSMFSTQTGRQLGEKDFSLAQEIANRAALAIDNARLYQEARDALQQREEFLLVAAHELRTPVTGLRGYAQLLANQLERTGELDLNRVRKSLEAINRQSTRLALLISQLLDVSRIQGGHLRLEPQLVELKNLLQNIIGLYENGEIEHKFTLVAPPQPQFEVLVDPLRFEQAITNLIDNAINFSPPGSLIKIELVRPSEEQIRVNIIDQGSGVPVERRPYIFDRFYRDEERKSQSGLGLGLYITRQIVELHRGNIAAQFPEEGGTHILINLPVKYDEIAS